MDAKPLSEALCALEQRDDFVGREVALVEDLQNFRPDISGGADNCDFVSHNLLHLTVPDPGFRRGDG